MITNMVLLSSGSLNGEDVISVLFALFVLAIVSMVCIIKGDDKIQEFGKFGIGIVICIAFIQLIAYIILMIIEKL